MDTLHSKIRKRMHDLILHRLCEWAVEGKAPPSRMVLLPTNRCNLRCLFCGAVPLRRNPDFRDYEDELSTQKWMQIVKEAAGLGVREWLIGGGGEPLTRADTVIAMIRTIKKISPESAIEISTNGSLLTTGIAKDLVKSGLDLIQLGIDGPDADTHDFLRGDGSFKGVTDAVENIALMKKKFNKEKPVVKIHVVLNSINYDKLLEMALLNHSLGANFFAVAAMRVDDGNRPAVEKAKLRLNDGERRQVHGIWKKVEEVAKQCNLELGPAFYEGMEEVSDVFEYETQQIRFKQEPINRFLSAFCFAPFYSLIVDWAGNVGPCACAGSIQNPNNNLATKGVKEVWYGEFFESARKVMLDGKPLDLEQLISITGQVAEGKALNPCEHCGINIERQEISREIIPLIKRMLTVKR